MIQATRTIEMSASLIKQIIGHMGRPSSTSPLADFAMAVRFLISSVIYLLLALLFICLILFQFNTLFGYVRAAIKANLPLWKPYLGNKSQNFSGGANFAASSAGVLPETDLQAVNVTPVKFFIQLLFIRE